MGIDFAAFIGLAIGLIGYQIIKVGDISAYSADLRCGRGLRSLTVILVVLSLAAIGGGILTAYGIDLTFGPIASGIVLLSAIVLTAICNLREEQRAQAAVREAQI
ncbi:hypothetical protein [Thalassobius sp. Cn5-15]|uniref:hypothetical protein n=1 Tax=Thalassobius sp. Cn5-15 TaxID=2917763 RepID=UPI001EF34E67|nr:hypothetical protein [Thalassobius sp. Cn5-15]MCG7494568.1 hypothetical protein [Thalassobius sp. Cn5-15]